MSEQQASAERVLELIADAIASRVLEKLSTASGESDKWLDSSEAADYLGLHRDTLRKLAASGAIPSEQEHAGCKRFFRRCDLEAWRAAGGASMPLPHLRIAR